MQLIRVDESNSGQRLDKYLNKLLPNAGSSFLYKMMRKKNITLNGKKTEGRDILKPDDEIRLFFADETYQKFKGSVNVDEYQFAFSKLKGITVIDENSDVIIFNKPAGVLSQKAEGNEVSLNEYLIGYLLSTGTVTSESLALFKPSVLNRLDRNTSGMVICGVSLRGSQEMSEAIKNKTLRKFYKTIVVGRITEDFELRGYLLKDEAANKVSVSAEDNGGDEIWTIFHPLMWTDDYTLMEVELKTGKPHQIRAHLNSIGHPIIGDSKYGNRNVNKLIKELFGLPYQLLHAYKLIMPDSRVITAPSGSMFKKIEEALF